MFLKTILRDWIQLHSIIVLICPYSPAPPSPLLIEWARAFDSRFICSTVPTVLNCIFIEQFVCYSSLIIYIAFIKSSLCCVDVRSSHQICSINKAVLKNFAIFTRKDLCYSVFLIKLQASAASVMLIKLSLFHDTRISEAFWQDTSCKARGYI